MCAGLGEMGKKANQPKGKRVKEGSNEGCSKWKTPSKMDNLSAEVPVITFLTNILGLSITGQTS